MDRVCVSVHECVVHGNWMRTPLQRMGTEDTQAPSLLWSLPSLHTVLSDLWSSQLLVRLATFLVGMGP